ncbi:sn-glycerol-3-phosphate ABC transporter ATP-binding protein UgpC [Shinella sp. S4-D37]|uniref:ABC transporter ATP-binding protein n=1 Tax=Shinella sp. S4-D37 TaxID=3161999 RepID=UPI0034651734
MARLEIDGIKKRFGNFEVIHGLDLEIKDGEFVAFVGPSGCGKSTALRMICGLETLSEGDIRIDGASVKNVSPSKRGVAMVFQSYALYPHMTVSENMGFSLRMEGVPKLERQEKVLEAARILQLDTLLHRKPKELSGGQRQRVAIGRAIVRKPKVFLFDEPLSNLDAELRVQMRLELARLHRELETTMIYVTHDQIEAMTLADRIVVLRAGKVEQFGTPMDLYHHPVNMFVAGFIGSPKMNFLKASVERVTGKAVEVSFEGLQGGPLVFQLAEGQVQAGDALTLGIRPEHLHVDKPDGPSIDIRFDFVERLGSTSYAYASGFKAGSIIATATPEISDIRIGDFRKAGFVRDNCFLFDHGGQTIPQHRRAPRTGLSG